MAWCKQQGLIEREGKDCFEHRAKKQTAVFQLGAREVMKLTQNFASHTKLRIWLAFDSFVVFQG